MTLLTRPAGWTNEEINRWLHYHGESTKTMSKLRTSLESKLIPISAYILISAVECYRRHPEMLLAIDEAMPAEEIGAAGRRPGNQIDSVHIWSQANIFLHGRNILSLLGRITPDHEPERCAIVLDFWRRAARAFRGDGELQALDAGMTCRPYTEDVVRTLADGCAPVADELWPSVKKLNATLTSYLFLLYFDTRSGMVDTGPYELGDGRVLLVRDFSKMGPSDFWWADEIAAAAPYRNLSAAFVLDGVEVRVNDWGTSVTEPQNYLDRVERFGLFTTDNGKLEPVSLVDMPAIHSTAKDAQRALYRNIAAMTRRERIDAGAYVYFTFLRPFAEVARVDEKLDWTVPRDSLDVYEMLELFEGTNAPPDPDAPYYWPIP
ncbi:MAG: hypothetical protein ACRDKJ_00145 [Actinomycetota bacterium]